MQNSIVFYKIIFLHVALVGIVVPCSKLVGFAFNFHILRCCLIYLHLFDLRSSHKNIEVMSCSFFLILWTLDVNWTCIRRSEDFQDVFWTSYVPSIYVLCPGRALFNNAFFKTIKILSFIFSGHGIFFNKTVFVWLIQSCQTL